MATVMLRDTDVPILLAYAQSRLQTMGPGHRQVFERLIAVLEALSRPPHARRADWVLRRGEDRHP